MGAGTQSIRMGALHASTEYLQLGNRSFDGTVNQNFLDGVMIAVCRFISSIVDMGHRAWPGCNPGTNCCPGPFMRREAPASSIVRSVVCRYGIAVVLVGTALGLNLFLFSHNFEGVEFSLFLIAIALTGLQGRNLEFLRLYSHLEPSIITSASLTTAFTSRCLSSRITWCSYCLHW